MRRLLSVSALVLLLAACKPVIKTADGDVQLNHDGTVNVTTDEGTMTTSKTLPSDWPTDVPPPADSEVSWSSSVDPKTGQPGKVAVFIVDAPVAKAMQEYTAVLVAQGWKSSGSMNAGGLTIMSAEKAGNRLAVSGVSMEGKTNLTVVIAAE